MILQTILFRQMPTTDVHTLAPHQPSFSESIMNVRPGLAQASSSISIDCEVALWETRSALHSLWDAPTPGGFNNRAPIRSLAHILIMFVIIRRVIESSCAFSLTALRTALYDCFALSCLKTELPICPTVYRPNRRRRVPLSGPDVTKSLERQTTLISLTFRPPT